MQRQIKRCVEVSDSACPPAPEHACERARAARCTLALFLAVLASAASAQAGNAPLNLLTLLRESFADAACSQERVVGQCFCAGVPCGLRIERFVPVALVETTRAPGDSLLGDMPLGPAVAGLTTSSSLSTTDNTSEAHVWSLPTGPLPGLSCMTCGAGSAASRAPIAEPAPSACGAADAIVAATASADAAMASPWLPHLAYASELDAVNWRTGCRDMATLTSHAPPLWCLAPQAALTPGAQTDCIGSWGPLRPRQMRDIGPDPLLYSAKTAVRAMSIAREQIGSFAYAVDARGKLQQAYPAASACFGVGTLPLPASPAATRPVAPSSDGRYAWIYWRPTSCCIGYGAARQCLRLHY